MKKEETLVLLNSGKNFMGFVGQETPAVVNGTIVCVGDVVEVAEGVYHNACKGVVAVFGNKVAVMGLATTPVSELPIISIIKSHKELTAGSHIESGFEVERLKE